jgi:hypothetical protein
MSISHPLLIWLAQTSGQPVRLFSADIGSPRLDASNPIWMPASIVLLGLLIGLGIFSKIGADRWQKQLRFETVKNRELQKKLKLAVETIGKMERNPDLIHSREFNLDYLRMRMAEETFNFAILNQIKVKVKDQLTAALRPSQANQGEIGIASKVRQIDEMFDVEYDPEINYRNKQRVLFRIQIKLFKLPAQASSVTIKQIIDCIETFLKPTAEDDIWQPVIQGRIANLRWDQKAKPTPLLVLEQTSEGSNVTLKPTRMVGR